jgi:alpha-ribazole phosphatase
MTAALRLANELAPTLDQRTRIVTSPQRRAVATAAIIAEVGGLGDVEVDPRWREADMGVAEGRTFGELSDIDPAIADALASGELAIDWPGGETHRSLAERVAAAWADLLTRDRPAVVVTHAGPLIHAVAIAADRPIHVDDLVAPASAVRVETPGGR